MRNKVTILMILIWTTTYGQLYKFKGTWISSSSDVIIVNDSLNKLDDSNILSTLDKEERMAFYVLGDTLSFQKRYYTSTTNYEKLYIDRYDFILLKLTDTSLTLKPTSILSKKFFNDRKDISFIKQGHNKDKTINFKKIIYHTSSCFGSCPTIDLEIDSNKNVYLEGQFMNGDSMFELDTIKSGKFTGRLNDSLYSELINLLQSCNLKTLTYPEIIGTDGPVTTIIIYYNGKRKYLKSMYPPTITYKLIEFLYRVNERANLKRTNKKRIIEE